VKSVTRQISLSNRACSILLGVRASFAAAACAWILLCLRWFDAATPWRPAWLSNVPTAWLLVAVMACVGWGLARNRLSILAASPPRSVAFLCVALALLFRLPLAWHGAAGYTTADGALSGIVAVHVRDGIDHHVFVPSVPYSGTLKSHVAAVLGTEIDMPRAFTLASVLFYAVYVLAVVHLGFAADPRAALPSGLYAAFAPPFVTHYSLSNDGNYVEVLAFGTWALVLAVTWRSEAERRKLRALVIGLLLGLGFWCHILVVFYAVAIGLTWLAHGWRQALRSAPSLVVGFVLADLPGILWNAGNGWESFRALVPGHSPAGVGPGGPSLASRAAAMITDYVPVLLGYDSGHGDLADLLFRVFSLVAIALAVWALVVLVRRDAGDVVRLLLVFLACNVGIMLLALRYVPGNPRYLLFSMSALPVLLALGLCRRPVLLALLIGGGALGSIVQSFGPIEQDGRWRDFVARLEVERVHFCFTDFYIATRINFLSEERVTCSSKLGPTRTEYFPEYRARVEGAPEAALVATDHANAEKLGRRLDRLGVAYRRVELMKPVLCPARKVDPSELFPEQSFAMR
jgi:hypothetical protein